MRKIREITLDEIAQAARTIQIAGADAEQDLFLSQNHEVSQELSTLREQFHDYIQLLIKLNTGIEVNLEKREPRRMIAKGTSGGTSMGTSGDPTGSQPKG